jgi:hypothetical protein
MNPPIAPAPKTAIRTAEPFEKKRKPAFAGFS